MSDTAADLRRCLDILDGWGTPIVQVPGWETRGKGAMTTRGHLEHHTAGGRGVAASLRVVTFGRAGLRNSLSRWYVDRAGVGYLVALNVSWHAGAGVKGTNATLSGTEGENNGVDEPWSEPMKETMARITAAEAIVFGYDAGKVWEHREHAPRRKVDRTDIDPDQWRARVAEIIEEGVDMTLKRGDRGNAVRKFQQALVAWNPNVLASGADGIYGEETFQAVARYQRAAELPPSGNIDGVTAALLSDYFPG